ncbi:hypothetical protein BH11BAC2_BH11BAC2_08540 [soil metagenome]
MISGKNIVVVGLQPWDIAIGSNCKNIAAELAKENRVLYVNPPLDRVTYLKTRQKPEVVTRLEVIQGKKEALTQIHENLWSLQPSVIAESINWIRNDYLFRMMNRVNNRRLANEIQGAMIALGFDEHILFNDQSMIRCYHLKEYLKPEIFIYYIRDNLKSISYFKRHALKMEEELITSADIVVTNSGYLADFARTLNPNAHFVGQGCDFTLFSDPSQIPVSEEMCSIPKPILGYVGFLTDVRLDINLLVNIAKSRPNWNLVLVGPEDKAFKKSELHQLSNVYFLGDKKPVHLPQFIQGFDIALNPQVINEVTTGNYPRKIDEYLAMGKPTVATQTPFMDYFKDYTYLARTPDEYLTQISKAMNENSKDFENARREFAMTHTWEQCVQKISEHIATYQFTS